MFITIRQYYRNYKKNKLYRQIDQIDLEVIYKYILRL